jgi:hypothetical protein
MDKPLSIPRPLVRVNQWTIVISVVASWFTHYDWLMCIPLCAGILGLLLDFNPIMRVAKLFLRETPSEYIAEDREQQKFNQYIAVACLGISVLSFVLNWIVAGYIFSALVALAAFVAILGFCIGCFIRFQWSQFRYRQSTKSHS